MSWRRTDIVGILRRTGLLPAAKAVRRAHRALFNTEARQKEIEHLRRERLYRQRFLEFKRNCGNVLGRRFYEPIQGLGKALIVGVNFPEVEIELGLIKALEIAGFDPHVLIVHRKLCREYYRLVNIKKISFLDDFMDVPDLPAAASIIEQKRSVRELIKFEYANTQAGRYAVSTAMRKLHVGSLDLFSKGDRRILAEYLAAGMAAAEAAHRVIAQIRPQLALFHDMVYTPEGELFDACIEGGVEVIKWHPAHKSNTLMLKRYHQENRHRHPATLSAKSWAFAQTMPWTDAHRKRLEEEIAETYIRGDWYSEAGTQFKKIHIEKDSVRREIGLDPRKKTAFIFPHILWDASLNWGADLFRDYEEWLIETVRAACANDRLNWVIKIHPANLGKSMQEGVHREPSEVKSLRRHIPRWPPHIFMLPAESRMSTLSLFPVMDYCLTVRGTIGIEAARLGIPVLTAGTGRYDRRGFTIDSDSREEYLARLDRIQEIPRISAAQRELAERFAYGLFLMRPYLLKSIINIKNKDEWDQAADLKEFVRWVKDSANPDFLMPPLDEKESHRTDD
jgi:hypothetical protein